MKNLALAFCGVLTDAGLDQLTCLIRGNHDLVPPKAGAKDFVAWARTQGWLVLVVTSDHMSMPELEHGMLEWLNHHGFIGRTMIPQDMVHFTTTPEKQIRTALLLGANVVIDPDLRNVQVAVSAGVGAIHFGTNGETKNFAEVITLVSQTVKQDVAA